jgi:anti-sigma factor RsiW
VSSTHRPMSDRITPEDLMRYLDGEMPDRERRALEAEVERSTELRRELAIYQAMQRDFGALSFEPPAPDLSVWGAVNRRVARPIGWVLFGGGAAVWLGYVAYVFAMSPVAALPKIAVAAVVIGLLVLLGTVVHDRYRDWLTDPYRDVHR